jgi:hypothetical protein
VIPRNVHETQLRVESNALGIYKFIDAYAGGGINLHPTRFYECNLRSCVGSPGLI